MTARMRRIASDYEQIKKKFANHKNIVVEPIGPEPAEKYKVTYYVNGIFLKEDGKIEVLGKHIVIITLHSEYPRFKPICTITTPIWHPNFRDGQVCIGDIWGAGESLADIIVNIGDMIQYKSWNSFSPLSADAAEWAIDNKHLFPVGNINLWTGEEENGDTNKDFDIELADEAGESELAETADASEEISVSLEDEDDASENSEAAEVSEETAELKSAEYTSVDMSSVKSQSDEDFEITAEELEGIEFVPTAERMQGSRYGSTAKGGKLNFKTVLIKGLLWALIGALVGFGVSELFDGLLYGPAAALTGHPELGKYYEYTEKANDELNAVNEAFEKYCRENGVDSESEDVLRNWLTDNADEFGDELDAYNKYYEKAQETLYDVYVDEFNENDDKLVEAMKNVSRTQVGMWSAIIALFIGMFLGLGEGIYYGSAGKAAIYALIGAGVSIVLGMISGYVAQWMYASVPTEESSFLLKAVVRGLGWAIMGAGVGLAVGLIKPGGKRILFCILGGLIGAFHGGFAFDYICEIIPNAMVARGVAIVVMGLLIGVGVGLLEQVAKSAWLKVIRGEFEGKEYLVFQGITSIGNTGKNTIALFKDKLIAPNHCDIIQEGNKYILVDKGSQMGTVVNGMRITRHVLRQGDAISIGNSVLIFNTK